MSGLFSFSFGTIGHARLGERMRSLSVTMLLRIVSVLLAGGVVSLMPLTEVYDVYVVIAFGHLVLAFWYQREAGKWGTRRFVLWMAFLVMLMLVSAQWYALFLFLTNLIFSVHMMLDETHLNGGKPSLFTTLESVPFILLYTELFAWVLFGVSLFVPALVCVAVAGIAYVVLSVRAKRRLDRVSVINLSWGVLALLLATAVHVAGSYLEAPLWFFALGMTHFFLWYGEFFRKVARDVTKKATYLTRTLIANLAGLGLLLVFRTGGTPVLALLFAPAFLNAWTIWHITSSVRGNIVRQSFSLTKG